MQEVNPEERIIISISREGLIYYGSEAINFETIPDHLKKDAQSPRDSIFLRADKDVKWNYIVSVIDAIRGAGFAEIRLVTKPFREPQRP